MCKDVIQFLSSIDTTKNTGELQRNFRRKVLVTEAASLENLTSLLYITPSNRPIFIQAIKYIYYILYTLIVSL